MILAMKRYEDMSDKCQWCPQSEVRSDGPEGSEASWFSLAVRYRSAWDANPKRAVHNVLGGIHRWSRISLCPYRFINFLKRNAVHVRREAYPVIYRSRDRLLSSEKYEEKTRSDVRSRTVRTTAMRRSRRSGITSCAGGEHSHNII